MKLSNGLIGLGVAVMMLVILYPMSTGAATSGFEAGRQAGYALGQATVAGIAVWALLKYVVKRRT